MHNGALYMVLKTIYRAYFFADGAKGKVLPIKGNNANLSKIKYIIMFILSYIEGA